MKTDDRTLDRARADLKFGLNDLHEARKLGNIDANRKALVTEAVFRLRAALASLEGEKS